MVTGTAAAGLNPDAMGPDALDPDARLVEGSDGPARDLLSTLAGEPLWESRYSGTGNGDHRAHAIAVHPNGLFTYTTGASLATSTDFATVANEALTGLPVWTARYDGPAGDDDAAHDIAVDPAGSRVFVTGTSRDAGGIGIATVAYDALTGLESWSARVDGAGSWPQTADVAVAPDGSRVYVTGSIGGFSTSHFMTLAYDAADGTELWRSTYVGSAGGGDESQDIVVSPDGSMVFITGWSIDAATIWDYATVAYDAATGDELWVSRYDGPANDMEFPRALGIDPDGQRVYVTGGSIGTGTSFDITTVAYDAETGAEEWVSRYDGPGSNSDSAWDLAVGADGQVYVTGFSFGTTTGLDHVTLAYDGETGAEEWVSRYDGPAGASDFGEVITVSGDGSTVYSVGYSLSSGGGFDYATLAYDADTGDENWEARYDGPVSGNDFPTGVAVDPLQLRVYVTGRSAGANGDEYATLAYLTG